MEENTLELKAILSILRRRKWDFILTAAPIFIVIAITVLVWPPTYRATSTILIEAQEIPREYVLSTVTAFADQRLQMLNQRIMSHSTLLDIINRYNLYPELKAKLASEEIVNRMRKSIKFETISADVVDQRTGLPATATIAFSVSFEGRNPEMVKQVANVLASLYLEENLKSREQAASGASKFIEDEARMIQTRLMQTDARISSFKRGNLDSLPELSQLNLQTIDRVERDIDQLKDRLRTTMEKEGYLQTQLASIPADISNPDKERLKSLRAKIVDLQTRYSNQYPDVIKTKQEIAELERRLSSSNQNPAAGASADNPAYVALAAQLSGTQSDIQSLHRQIKDAERKRDEYRGRIQAGPRVEEAYKLLQIERNNLQLKYDDLTKKLMEARIAQGLEKGQMGERFTLINAAGLPTKPARPNIPAVLLIGLILGVGSGIGVAALKEHADGAAHTARDLALATNLPVLAGISVIVNRGDVIREKELRKKQLIAASVILLIGLLIIHFFVVDLSILWTKISRQLS